MFGDTLRSRMLPYWDRLLTYIIGIQRSYTIKLRHRIQGFFG